MNPWTRNQRPSKQLRSDRGTNFFAASAELGMRPSDEKKNSILSYLHSKGCTWKFNPSHASHMGGVWERMIGVTRTILDCMLLQTGHTNIRDSVHADGRGDCNNKRKAADSILFRSFLSDLVVSYNAFDTKVRPACSTG